MDYGIYQHELGYFTVRKRPTEAELARYYQDKYYQEGSVQYQDTYSEEELSYLRGEALEYIEILSQELRVENGKILDVGCGEGWVLKTFKDAGWEAHGLDYSSFAITKFHPELLANFIEGDFVKTLSSVTEKFDLIVLKNVVEHVLDPHGLLSMIREKLLPSGVLVIKAPNDFSRLQNYLIEHNLIQNEFWVTPPEHLNYFGHKTLNNLLESVGYKCVFESCDYPIDFDLVVPDRNYVNPVFQNAGKNAHLQRIRIENFMRETSLSGLVGYHHSLAQMGLGRNIVNYYTLV